MKTILLPTDLSENSINAIHYSLKLYHKETCNYVLLNTYEVNGYYQKSKFIPVPGMDSIHAAEQNAIKNLEELVAGLQTRYADLDYTFEIKTSNYQLIEAIKQCQEKLSIHAIIIGTQGNTAAHNVAFGSNTVRILEEIRNSPVIAVPSHVHYSGIREVVLATGFKMDYHHTQLEFIKEFILSNEASLRILHIKEEGGLSQKQVEKRRNLKMLMRNIPHSFHYLSHVNIPLGIYCFTESRASSMVAFINKKHSFLGSLLFEPLYKDLGKYSQIPVMVLQSENL